MAKTNDGKIIKELVEWNPDISEYDRVYPLTHTESIIDGRGNTLADLLTITPGELKAQVVEVLEGAPEEYNTLLEIADALKNNKDSIGTIISGLSTKESTANKNKPNGYLGLTADNTIPSSYLSEGNIDLATQTSDGLMSSGDKSKLDGVETGAQKNIMTSADKTKLNELSYTKAMTQAQYDDLSQAEKDRSDVWYGIFEE